jgi:ATP-dependent helicase HrpB
MNYPVLDIVPELRQRLETHRIVMLQSPPGAGKSTVVPLQLMREPWLAGKKISMLEPRRLAARAVAERMAELQGETAGQSIGYRIRFENRISQATRIEVVTEGILTRMIQHDNALEGVGLVIFDEFHERSLQADLALALCLQVQHLLRDDLRILIMSATLDGEALAQKLNAPLITSTGKQFPVDIRYAEASKTDERLPNRVASAVVQAFRKEEGDLLVFLPGAGEIRQVEEKLIQLELPAAVHPLYGDLPFQQQRAAILPDASGRRKIVLATSIAETSLTIEGISIVIDSGYSRVPRYDPRSGLTRLETMRVTKDSATQRAGRAGRLGPGIGYRLWTQAQQHTLQEQRRPEILEADLTPLVLELKAWGVRDLLELTWITPPPEGSVKQSLQLLQQLEAIDDDGRITERGKRMVELPTHPRIAHMLLESEQDTKQLALATDLAALLEERDPLPREAGVDLSLRLACLRQWRRGERTSGDRHALERIERLAASWRKLFKLRQDDSAVDHYAIGSRIALAYPERIARQQQQNSERYKLVNARIVLVQQHDALVREPWLAVAHLDPGTKEGKIFTAAPLAEEDLEHLAVKHAVVRWNDTVGRVEGVYENRVGSLVLSSLPMSSIPAERKNAVLLEVIRTHGLSMLGWNEVCDTWQARVMSLRAWSTQEPWPDVSTPALLNVLEVWLLPFLDTITKQAELARLDILSMVNTLLPWELQRRLDHLVPERIEVPSGSKIRIMYHVDGRAPVMEVRLQEVFGLLETPSVNEGTVRVVMHLLSPGYKPVQVTQDLHSFWHTTYHEVRKELRTRYPKHSWPEDPWTARAVRGVVRRKT